MIEILSIAPIMLVLAFFLFMWDQEKTNENRLKVFLFTSFISVTYLIWRTLTTFTYFGPESLQDIWYGIVYSAELLAFIEVSVFLLIMSKTIDRSSQADKYEKINFNPNVDVFIPTYNEPIDVLEKTIIGAKHIDYENKTVWVLDDGKREWLKHLCQKHGVQYLIRQDNSHAKAGNINNGLANASGDFVCIFDADFVPHKNFIKRTIGFFTDETIGIVQTPQHFYNKDPVQTNLGLENDYPDEQRLFFDEMAVCRDAWDSAFCCGSCSIIRREALDKVGGIPTESITEDLLTTLVLLRKGYKTIYLNEKLSVGLAAESLTGYFVQRQRWARGAIQSLFLKTGPFGSGLTFIQRLLFLPISWVVQYPVRLMVILVPIFYLIFGLMPIIFTSFSDLMFYQGTVIVTYLLTMNWLVGRKYFPLLSTAVNVFAIFKLLPTIIHSLYKPFGQGFRVTPKGTNVEYLKFDKFTFVSVMLFSVLTLLGLFINAIPEWGMVDYDNFFPIAAGWSLLNMIMLTISGLLCFEKKKNRVEERFTINEECDIIINNEKHKAKLIDLSLSGFKVSINDIDKMPEKMLICINDVDVINCHPLRKNGSIIVGTLNTDDKTKEQLISKLFSGKYDNNVSSISNVDTLLERLKYRVFN